MNENTARVTAADVEELLTSTIMEPTLVRWLDLDLAVTDVIEVVAGPLLNDISYSNRDREYQIITTAADLRSSGDWDTANPTQDDFDAFAEMLNDA